MSGRGGARSRPSSTREPRMAKASALGEPSPKELRAISKRNTVAPPQKGPARQHIACFQISNEQVGKGGYATVYKGLNVENGDFVAVKQIVLVNMDKEQIHSIMGEIELLKALDNVNIVQYIDSFEVDDYLLIVMEFVEGGSLSQLGKRFGHLHENTCAIYISQVLDGVAYLHDQGVIHRDIKGANVLVTRDGSIKLADFGVSTKIDEARKSDSVVGTPYWMAPEVIEMAGPSTASDIWSVGCTVIELLTGSPPYFDLAPMPALFRIVQDEYPPLPPDVSPALRDFLLQCFQKDPNLRISASGLLKHPWIASGRRKGTASSIPRRVDSVSRAPQASNAPTVVEKRTQVTRPPPTTQPKVGTATRKMPVPTTKIEPRRVSVHSQKAPFQPPKEDEEEDWDADFDLGEEHTGKGRLNYARGAQRVRSPVPRSGGASPRDSADISPRNRSPNLLSKFTEGADDNFDDLGDQMEAKMKKESNIRVIHPEAVRAGAFGMGKGFVDMLKVTHDEKLNRFREATDTDDLDAFDLEDFGLEEEEDEDLSLLLKRKMKTEWDEQPMDTNNYEVDPFADVLDFEEQAERDKFSRLSAEILKLIAILSPTETEERILEACSKLIVIFKEHPVLKRELIAYHGAIPIMEMLEVSQPTVLHAILQVVNQIIEGNTDFQEYLSLVGLIPAMITFAGCDSPPMVRREAALFVQKMCHASDVTLQMFIACRGLPVLTGFLEPDYGTHKGLVLIGIDCISKVFDMSGITPKNDFCRLFVKSGILERLAKTLSNLVKDSTLQSDDYVDKICTLLFYFSQGDNGVKMAMVQKTVTEGLLSVVRKVPQVFQVKLFKCFQRLSMDSATLDILQSANIIPHLISFLDVQVGPVVQDMHKQLLSALFNLCRLSPQRQEQAAVNGIIPHLQHVVTIQSALKEFALQILCEMSHASKRTRAELFKCKGTEFFLQTLSRCNWIVHALEALAACLADDPKRVDSIMQRTEHVPLLLNVFRATGNFFENALEPFLRILTVSDSLSRVLGDAGCVPKVLEHLDHPKAIVRKNLLRILMSLFEKHAHPATLVQEHKLVPLITRIVESDNSALVREMGNRLLRAFKKVGEG